MPLAPGTRLGPYEILAPLGEGGMGQVYKARDTRLGRSVAIKVVAEEFSNRFQVEARAISGLNHPHICTLYDVGPGYLVMELVEGETLASRLKQGRLPIDTVLRYGAAIAGALAAANAQGIVHRDLKPGNLMVSKSGIKVLDFGLAKFTKADETVTASHVIQGTPAYMAPEQSEGKACDARTDIYALGLVLYEMAAGKRLKQGESPDLAAFPERFAHVVQRCLEQVPDHRWQSAQDLQAELEWAGQTPANAPASKPRSRWAWAAIALAAAAGAAAAILIMGSAGQSPEPQRVVEFVVFPPKGTAFATATGGPWAALSPDGSQLAFVALRPNGEQQIWVRALDSSTSRPLQGTQGASRLFWSPDSRSIGYFANGQLLRADLEPGTTRVLADVPYNGGMNATWAGDVIVFSASHGLSRVPAGGGPAKLILRGSEGAIPNAPTFLPDGRRFLYWSNAQRAEQSRLCVGSLDSTEKTCLPNPRSAVRYAQPGYLLFAESLSLAAWAFDPRGIKVTGESIPVAGVQTIAVAPFLPPAVTVSQNGILAYASASPSILVLLNRSGGEIETIGSGHSPTVSRDGKHIVVVRSDPRTGRSDLWHYDRARGAESRLTFDPGDDSMAVISPDGEDVLFVSNRSGVTQLYRKPVSGAGGEELVGAPESSSPDWTADGRFVLYQQFDPKTEWDLWAFSVTSDRTPIPIARTQHGERAGRFSPDGHWVAYDSTESGRREVWVQPFPPTGSRWQISNMGGTSPRWRGDGKELFYISADGMLTVVAVEPGRTFERRAPKPLFQTMFRGGVYASYAVSHDGQRFLINVPPRAEDATPITVIMNWTTLLKK